MKSKSLKLPVIILSVALILMVTAYLLTSVRKMPTVTEQDFNYSITYKVDGETKTVNAVYTCRFDGFGGLGIDPLARYYSDEYEVEGEVLDSRCYTIDRKDGYELYIVMLFNESYLMNDTENSSYESFLEPPCLEASDADGNQYAEDELPDVFDAQIVSWDYPQPIENTFVFAGFGGLYAVNMMAMVLVGILALILCVILVRKGEGVTYRALDTIGIVFNFVIAFIVFPVLIFVSVVIQAYSSGPEWPYQALLCLPPITPLTLAASVSLRRKGYRLSGFLVQFLSIVLFIILAIL